MKQSAETFNNYKNAYLFIYLFMYLFIFSSTLFLLVHVNCIFVKKLIKKLKKKVCFEKERLLLHQINVRCNASKHFWMGAFSRFDVHTSPLFVQLNILKTPHTIVFYAACFVFHFRRVIFQKFSTTT